jgi:PAS domain S-box-containing protein
MAEQRLKLQEQQYRLLFQTNPNPMWVFDVESLQILAVNDAAIAQYGYALDEFLQLTLHDLRTPEDVAELRQALSPVRAPAHFSGEFRHVRKNGSLFRVEIYSSPVIWDGANARMVTGIDVTERRRAERVLRESHERFEAVARATINVIWDWDTNRNTIWWNDQFEAVFGYPANQIGTDLESWSNRIHPDDLPRILESVRKVVDSDEATWSDQYRFRRYDGDYAFVIDRGYVLRDDRGKPLRMIGAMEDVTERRKGEERLREQADIIDRAQDAIVIRNYGDRHVTFWNKGAERLYGWSAEEVAGHPDVTTLADPQQADSIISALHASGEFRGDVKQFTKDGRELIVQERATLVRNADGTPRSILIICTDITEQKKLEAQFLRAQRLESIGTLASGVAHDLNNIIAPILMCAQVLREENDPAARRPVVDLVEASAQRGANIIKQVLTFARGVEGERVLMEPAHFINDMAKVASETFPKNIQVQTRYTEGLWPVESDPTQVHQILLNLCVNARDAMPRGGTLTIGVENFTVDENYAGIAPGAKPGPHLRIDVIDTGTGIPRAVVDKIFDPFFTTKEIGKGTGLGLSTVLGIVKSHGGFVTVYSELAVGTTFKVFLPANPQGDTPDTADSAKIVEGGGETILIVDDEAAILQVTEMMLRKYNYNVLVAADGPEALAIFATHMLEVKAVLADLAMPYLDGVALARALKKMNPELPIIVSTGRGDDARIAELKGLGVEQCLTKPYNIGQLLTTLQQVLHAERAFLRRRGRSESGASPLPKASPLPE